MNANELRLNNLFRQKGSNFVETATFETFDLLSRCAIVIDGVPINEDWLITFGFEKKNNGEFINNGYSITFSKLGYPHFWISEFNDIIISYIHQLQNIYFDLTGNELLKI